MVTTHHVPTGCDVDRAALSDGEREELIGRE
jgi:hypothetical protein